MTIAVCGMLDEREAGLRLLKEKIEQRGHKTILIDFSIGTGGIKTSLKADITCNEVARAGGMSIDTIRGMLTKQWKEATSTMAEGLTQKVLELYQAGELKGIVAVSGMTGAFMSLTAMKALPGSWGESSIMFTVADSGIPSGVIFSQFVPPSCEMCTRPSSVPAHSSPALCGDSSSANIVQ